MTARPAKSASAGRLGQLSAELKALRERLRAGGGPERVERQHQQGKLTARERVALLLDADASSFEIGLLVACDLYDGQAPAAGVVTCVGRIAGRESGCICGASRVTRARGKLPNCRG